jgi:hypothetical protein
MIRWLLLLLTIGCACMAYDAFRWRSAIPRTPFKTIAGLLPGGQSHLSLAEQSKLRDGLASSLFAGRIVWLFLGGTVLLGVLTVRAFLE